MGLCKNMFIYVHSHDISVIHITCEKIFLHYFPLYWKDTQLTT